MKRKSEMNKRKTWYINEGLKLPESVILVGDQNRLKLFEKELNNTTIIAGHHNFLLLTGEYKLLPTAVLAYGMGAPAVAVAIEELSTLGVKTIVKAGTVMGVSCRLGSLVLGEASVRMNGTSLSYLPIEFPAIPDHDLLDSFAKTLTSLGYSFCKGLIASFDSLHPNRLLKKKSEITLLRKVGVVGLDMETATVYIVSKFLGIKAVSLCAATVSFRTFDVLDKRPRHSTEKLLVKASLECLWRFCSETAGR